jgi:hypothetical protein
MVIITVVPMEALHKAKSYARPKGRNRPSDFFENM